VSVQGGLAACLFATALVGSAQLYARREATARNVPLAGVWVVDQFQLPGNMQPLFTTKLSTEMHVQPGDDRWTKFVVGGLNDVVLQLHNGAWDHVDMSINKDHTQLEMSDSDDPNWKVRLAIQQSHANSLRLVGTINAVAVDITLHADDKVFPLVADKYHFIRTYP
jgi:hypothetical protein